MTPDEDDGYRGSYPRATPALRAWHAAAPATRIVDAAQPIVDPHHHLFGNADDALHYRIEDLHADLAGGHDVIGTVYIEAYGAGWRTSGPPALRPVGEVERIVALTPSPIETPHGLCQVAAGIVASAEISLGAAVSEVIDAELEAAQGRLRGVRQHAATIGGTVGRFIKHPPRPQLLGEARFREGFAKLAGYGLAFDAWIYHTQLDELIALADAFPDTTIVLNHVGAVIGVAEFRAQRSEVLAFWRQRLRALAERPNVHVKIGGMGMPVFGFGFEHGAQPAMTEALARAWQPLIDTTIDAFGTTRCMFESNFPVDKQSCSYTELWNTFKRATTSLSADERDDLFYRSACRTYRLPELEAQAERRRAARTQEPTP